MRRQRASNCALTSSFFFFSSSVSSSSRPSLVQQTSLCPSYSLSCCTAYSSMGSTMKSTSRPRFLRRSMKGEFSTAFLVDPIDEYAVQQLKEYDGHKLVCCTKEGLALEETEDEKKKKEEVKAQFEALCRLMKDILGDKA